MAGLPEELEFELEALRATYGDDLVDVQQGDAAAAPAAAVVAVPVAPRTDGGAEHESFVAGRLVMAVGPSYPDAPPEVHLADAKGAPRALGPVKCTGPGTALAAFLYCSRHLIRLRRRLGRPASGSAAGGAGRGGRLAGRRAPGGAGCMGAPATAEHQGRRRCCPCRCALSVPSWRPFHPCPSLPHPCRSWATCAKQQSTC